MSTDQMPEPTGDMPQGSSPVPVDFYIPDLCRVRALFLLIVTTELMALLFALAQPGPKLLDWEYLALLSLFGQWTVLSCAALLCATRRYLSRLSTPAATTAALGMIMLIVFAYSLISVSILNPRTAAGDLDMLYFLRNQIIALIISGITLRYFFLQHQWQRQRQSALLARLEALQARIRPHFLFNSMNTIASLIATRPSVAEEAVLDLSELFRANLQTQAPLIPLNEEIALCRNYLKIEALRMGDRMRVTWDIPDDLTGLRIPPLTLQPLIENAIYHGIQPLPEGGEILIRVERRQSEYTIMIRNPFNSGAAARHGNQIALGNIRDRLQALCGDQAVIKTSRLDNRFTVVLRLPVNISNAGNLS